ncbi:MAG: bifunctional helix-turn-helix domain-containing protein/methylated-DNA--[protein]-cysteine S-methyltransferase [Pseudomonadota bacterium]
MTTMEQLCDDYQRVEKAIAYLESHVARQPSLTDIAASVHLSEYHFQRLFSRWTGISPKRFLQFLTAEYAKSLLNESPNVLDAAFDAGLSGSGRLHDLLVVCEAVTPGDVRRRGAGLTIIYGFRPSPFGRCLIAATDRGICHLRFVWDTEPAVLVAELTGRWPRAMFIEDNPRIDALADTVFGFPAAAESAPLHLFVKGTNFQIQVWQALLKIPLGAAVTYEDIARHIGMPRAARAVGNAVGSNPIPFLIPCHRVIRKSGVFGNYGEGPLRKKAMLGWEAAMKARGRAA